MAVAFFMLPGPCDSALTAAGYLIFVAKEPSPDDSEGRDAGYGDTGKELFTEVKELVD